MSEGEKKRFFKKPTRKMVMALGAVLAVAALSWLIFGKGISGGSTNVNFTNLSKDDIPKTIETDVIPEYRELERALGCLVDGKVYVVVTRGEKPTAGYDVSIEKITLEDTKNSTSMKVYATFSEPEEGIAVSQISTYPYAVAYTELTKLPSTIELIVKYAQ